MAALLRSAGRYIRFGVVGGSGVVVDTAVLFVLADVRTLHWDLSLSKALAAEVAIGNNFIWNDLWTFRDLSAAQAGGAARAGRFIKFNVICLLGVALNVLLLSTQVRVLHFNVYLANLASIFIVSLWNFLLNLKFGWGSPRK
jgi:dolichol-phosphate mannosyltransferase